MNIADILLFFVQLFVSSMIVFFVVAALVEICLYFFSIKNPRIRAFCRALPILKLPFDLIFYKIAIPGLLMNINPFSCDKYTHDFFLGLLPSHLFDNLHASHAQTLTALITNYIPSVLLQISLIGLMTLSIAVIGRKILQFLSSTFILNQVCQHAIPCTRMVENPLLKENILHAKAFVLTSSQIQVPFAAHTRYIILPDQIITTLSQDEFEAIIAHELEHLRWHDPILKFACSTICALFWWIPTKWWINKLEDEQEQASDASINAYGIDNHALASAVVKVISSNKKPQPQIAAFCHFTTTQCASLKRLKIILNTPCNYANSTLNYAIATLLLIFTLCSVWIC